MSKQPLSFQQVIMKLHEFWAAQGCVIWEPYNVQVGAGTGNPATLLRVLGPEPWRVAYVEPSVRPDDGRFGENPNRMQKYYQYQVILKPDPGNPQELYLKSLEALGIDPREHDIRFVEDNWESPALGAWGLGWEVWLDGQEITQFTYFQQAGGLELNPVSVEITYGVERIVLALQGKDSAWAIDWMPGLQYRDLFLEEEIQHCRYYFDIADVDALKKVYDTYEREYHRALEGDALIAAYDYVLKCSHLFNVLDTRGAIGVTERASYFRRMRDMTRTSARAYLQQRERLEFPLTKLASRWNAPLPALPERHMPPQPAAAGDVIFELGVEELPADDVDTALAQLRDSVAALFAEHQLSHEGLDVHATPRRLMFYAKKVSPFQPDSETIEKGPPANRAFDAEGKPTKAAEGFAKSRGIALEDLTVAEVDGGQYVMAKVFRKGRAALEILAEALPKLIAEIKFGKSMRWNATNTAFSRPVRWIVAMYNDVVIPFSYAGISTDNVTRGLRPYGSPEIALLDADSYWTAMQTQGIVLDSDKRRERIMEQVNALAAEVHGRVPVDAGLVAEVVNLVETPTAIRGTFDAEYLTLPRDVLVTVMRKHQRYFPVEDADGKLMPYFITVRNGDSQHANIVAKGNEHVLQARFYDASFFYKEDRKKSLSDHLQRLATLTFEEHLGSMLDKNQRVAGMVSAVGKMLGFKKAEIDTASKAAKLAKADLGSNMVVEMTSLQGTMGREYALLEGIDAPVANAIFEHWQPRNADDSLPASAAGALLAIVDRLDSLTGLFGAGLAPKSTADPYGLRRAALGLLQIMIAREIDASLPALIDAAAAAMPIEVKPEVRAALLEFIAGRLRVWLGDQGYAPDVINAVLAEQAHNPYRAVEGVRQLSEWVTHENWERTLDSFARCVRITRGENEHFAVDPKLFQEQEERNLYEAYVKTAAAIGDKGDINTFLSAFEPIVPVVSKFFGENPGEGVLVNTDDARVRTNRIALLQQISALQKGRADLSQLVGF